VPPIHQDVMQRTVGAVRRKQSENPGQEIRELGFAHFARRHFEIPVLDCSEAGSVSRNFGVVGRVGKHHVGAATIHQRRVAAAIQRVFTVDPVASQFCTSFVVRFSRALWRG
jgi:hypothetical protein